MPRVPLIGQASGRSKERGMSEPVSGERQSGHGRGAPGVAAWCLIAKVPRHEAQNRCPHAVSRIEPARGCTRQIPHSSSSLFDESEADPSLLSSEAIWRWCQTSEHS